MESNDGENAELRVAAVSALYQAEISGNTADLQATTTTALGLLAYLGVTAALIAETPAMLLVFLPLPLLAAVSFQVLRAAVVVRRAQSARQYELVLARYARALKQVSDGRLGSGYFNKIDDVALIWAEEKWSVSKACRLIIAVFAYFGLYATSCFYTFYLVHNFAQRPESSSIEAWLWLAAYIILWLLVIVAAISLFFCPGPGQAASVDLDETQG